MNIGIKLNKKLLNIAQKLLNKVYMDEGLTDQVLNMQIRINELRYRTSVLNEDGKYDKEYSQ